MGKLVSAADLTEQITLQAPAAGIDSHGQGSTSWQVIATLWAKCEPLRGRDFFAAAAAGASVSVRFAIRYRPDVLSATRVLWRGVAYDVAGAPIDVDGRRHTLELMCESGVRDAR
ncbi:phage head closure protein [Aquabacterium sp. OR-4]|uniref:phage head closure protein n=1 Tax=Aquabacterium sp. OR-4 TaxID=2978127 RepID=UPI0021B1F102|nr:phage head closure protein [Aquabacterium sp. OR-4]MDT7836458.1 phage head closure protein [Aquabacterium sp. OR-4]